MPEPITPSPRSPSPAAPRRWWAFLSDYGPDESGKVGELYASHNDALEQYGKRETMAATIVELVEAP